MSLLIIGTVLEVATRTGGRPGEEFTYTEVALLLGKSRVERVRLAKDFRVGAGGRPNEGDEVAFEVGVRAYSGRSGAGYNLTAFADVSEHVQASIPAPVTV